RDAPAGAVAPVHERAEPRVRGAVVELLDAERLRRGLCRCGREGAAAQPRLDRARDRHRGGPRRAREGALADPVRERCGLHRAIASCSSLARAPRRSARWSPTRSAFAIAVSAGFTAVEDGKKLVSTTYRLSRSCALQSTSSADVSGSWPK